MKRFFTFLAVIVALWVLGSFLGVMFDPARANLWTQSLMWAMLSCVILAPVFLFVSTSSDSPTPRSESRQPFEVDEEVDVSETEQDRGWPYSSEQDEINPGGSGAVRQNN